MRVSNNKQYLEQWRGKWRVTVSVPKALQKKLGTTRLKQALNTDSLSIANQLKWPIVREFHGLIASAQKPETDIRAIAEELRRQRAHAESDIDAIEIEAGIAATVDILLGQEIGSHIDPYTGEEEPVYAPEAVKRVTEFNAVLKGQATLLNAHHNQYMGQLTVKPRTKSDDKRAIALLERWCSEQDIPPYLQSFPTRKSAVAFTDALPALEPELSPVTLNKYVRRLSRYWQWLEKRDEVASNVWAGLSLAVPQTPHDEEERPFTDDEMVKLLSGDASPEMHDLMRIAALTGCRLDPIVCLRVRDCLDEGMFIFKPQKKEKAQRLCPIHPALKEIIERRKDGKSPDDPIFPEWPAPKNPESTRERSFKASNHFTDYRRSVGVADEIEGKRRSLVNFHSFRRWFITKAEQADQPESLIASVVGHKRQGMTLGVYSGGPAKEQARRCVEAVQLPATEKTEAILMPMKTV
ncbi:tyrosine-type recombinase/integrase [Ochrobactrum soli]|uniref:Tyrosine-type recombinase/integrase n=1 Tax=Ochrobactrum soli TaxID=2448455 RepID=A0A849KNU5_9HYPH|nr:tyrosine-type recombinase/integrase [[Ochrobactrum] soli]